VMLAPSARNITISAPPNKRAGLDEPALPVLPEEPLRLRRLRSLLHIGLFAGVDRSRKRIAVRLQQVLALVDVLRPLSTALVDILLTLVDILVHRVAALLYILVRLLPALRIHLVRSVASLQRARHQVIASLLARLRRVQHTHECANSETR